MHLVGSNLELYGIEKMFDVRIFKNGDKDFGLTFRHRASYILGQAFYSSPENAFYIFNQQTYFIN